MERLRLTVGWAIVTAWVVSLAVDMTVPAYDPPATIHLLMMLVAGSLFGPYIAGKRKHDE